MFDFQNQRMTEDITALKWCLHLPAISKWKYHDVCELNPKRILIIQKGKVTGKCLLAKNENNRKWFVLQQPNKEKYCVWTWSKQFRWEKPWTCLLMRSSQRGLSCLIATVSMKESWWGSPRWPNIALIGHLAFINVQMMFLSLSPRRSNNKAELYRVR